MKRDFLLAGRSSGPGPGYVAANIALILVVALLALFVFLSYYWDREEQRRKLIADFLWVEQNFRFHVESDEIALVALGQEIVDRHLNATEFEDRVRHLQVNNPELVQVALMDSQGATNLIYPVSVDDQGNRVPDGLAATAEASKSAARSGKPVYSRLYRAPDGDPRFALYVPVFVNGALARQVVGEFSLAGMMRHMVPWWYAERYNLTVLDASGRVVTQKSNVGVDPSMMSYEIPLALPPGGLSLRAVAYPPASGMTRNLFLAAIVGLSLATLWSLLALRRDMTQRIAAENELIAHHAFRQAIEDSMLTGLVVRDLDGTISYTNPAFCRMTGYSAGELTGSRPPYPFSLPQLPDTAVGDAPRGRDERQMQSKSGARIDVLVHEAPLIDAQNEQTGWMDSVLDIGERKRAEEMNRRHAEKLQLTSRLVTMGEMASSLAHELNQPLAAINGYLVGALNRLRGGRLTDGELIEVLDVTAAQATRAGNIVHRMHAFMSRREPHRAECDLNQVTAGAISMLEAEAGRQGARIRLDLEPELPLLNADSVLLEQVVLNLAKNGIEAMSDAPTDQRELEVRTQAHNGTVTVSVADRGIGVAPDVAKKIFSPFFTTKSAGMGMGLNICRSIVELHSGKLWFEANGVAGSVFSFSLPLDQP
ncbi:MAG TPA: ATP-binding protein [Burkholderiaceae bacterium]|jgi:two-component system sensor histidine kinase DctS|nr:ATP-binding protein [Burkholderiaceae bacterium]